MERPKCVRCGSVELKSLEPISPGVLPITYACRECEPLLLKKPNPDPVVNLALIARRRQREVEPKHLGWPSETA